jgi:4-alpha-glucanotransferase|uniref:4-alpha-glucanotransferase n=1 Tax=Fagus sylvatica TaxID=28930 RepID=A0A2N9EXD4_FAGSY
MAISSFLSLMLAPPSPKLYSYSSLSSTCFKPKPTTSSSFPCQFQNGNVSTLFASTVGVGEDLPVDYGEWFPKPDPENRRRAGVLLHPTSFRGPHGIGDLGDEAFRFIDWLHEAGCSVWQVCFLNAPVLVSKGN